MEELIYATLMLKLGSCFSLKKWLRSAIFFVWLKSYKLCLYGLWPFIGVWE